MDYIKKNFLTSNALKIIACVSMLIDHIGSYLFPNILFLRIIGRLAFPIFAYFIAKGCIYTKDKFKRFVLIFGVGMILEGVFSNGNILLTFSLSLILIYCYKLIINGFKNKNRLIKQIFSIVLFIVMVTSAYFINYVYPLDYGFFGILLPLIIYMGSLKVYGLENVYMQKCIDAITMFVGLTLVVISLMNFIMVFAYLSIPLIVCYNNKKGNLNLKYMFYIFYPLHLIILRIISLFV